MMTKERIAELRQLVAMRHEYGSDRFGAVIGECIDEIESLQSRVQELEKDKERLDWIEENCTYNGGGNGGVYSFRSPMDTEFFRQAIDAAMKGAHDH